MFNPSQPSFHFPNQYPPTNPNNPYLPFSQPVIALPPNSEPSIHPPGTDPYANIGSYPLTHAGFQGQPPCGGEDPNAASHNWVVKQAAPVRYDAVVNSGNENSFLPTSSNSLENNTLPQPPLTTDKTSNVPHQPKAVELPKVKQTVRCDVCKVDCNTKDVYEKHLLGKKHKKNLRMKSNPTTTMLSTSNDTINNISCPNQTLAVASSGELDAKRKKLLISGAAVDSVRVCTICNVACNSQEVFNKHMAGRKHATQAALAALGEIGPYFAAVRSQLDGTWKKVPKKIKVVQSAWCEVCKINCNSNDVYLSHLSGKKHQKNLEQLRKLSEDPSATSSTNSSTSTCSIIGPTENPEANKSEGLKVPKSSKRPAEEDLESKKRKVVDAGGVGDAIRTCRICNVVCNSQKVFISHLGGQKHLDMVKKLTAAGVAIPGP